MRSLKNSSKKNPITQYLECEPYSPQKSKKLIFCCFSYVVWHILLWQPKLTPSVTMIHSSRNQDWKEVPSPLCNLCTVYLTFLAFTGGQSGCPEWLDSMVLKEWGEWLVSKALAGLVQLSVDRAELWEQLALWVQGHHPKWGQESCKEN